MTIRFKLEKLMRVFQCDRGSWWLSTQQIFRPPAPSAAAEQYHYDVWRVFKRGKWFFLFTISIVTLQRVAIMNSRSARVFQMATGLSCRWFSFPSVCASARPFSFRQAATFIHFSPVFANAFTQQPKRNIGFADRVYCASFPKMNVEFN